MIPSIALNVEIVDFNDRNFSAPINSRLNVVVRSPTPFGLGRNGCWPSRGSQLPRAFPFIFSLCCPLNDRRRAAHSIYKIGSLFSLFLFSCPALALLLLLMSGNVHPNHLSLLCVRWKCDLAGQVSAMLHLLQMGPSKVLTTFPLQSQSSRQLSLLELPPLPQHCDSFFGLLGHVYLHCTICPPPLLMLHSRVTLVFKPPILLLPILYPFPLPLHHRLLLLAVLLCLLLPLLPLTLSGFFNGMLEVFVPGALDYFTFSHPIQSTLSASRNPILTPLPLSGFLDSLLCVLIAPTPGLAFSLLMPRTPAAALSFLSGRAYLSLNFPPPLFLCLIPTLIM